MPAGLVDQERPSQKYHIKRKTPCALRWSFILLSLDFIQVTCRAEIPHPSANRGLVLGARSRKARHDRSHGVTFERFSSSFKVLSTRRRSADQSIAPFRQNFPVG